MNNTPSVLIIAPNDYLDDAELLAHEIAKIDHLDVASWTIKQYQSSKATISAKQLVIFLGDSQENPGSATYLKVIKNIVNKHGVCWGFDGSKAVIYGDGNLLNQHYLTMLVDSIKNGKYFSGEKVDDNLRRALAVSFFTQAATSGALYSLSPFALIGKLILDKFNKSKRQCELKKQQVEVGATLFLAESLDEWLGNDR